MKSVWFVILTVMLAIDRLSSWLKVPSLVVSVVFLILVFMLLSVAAKGSRVGKMRRPDRANIPRTVPNKNPISRHQKRFVVFF